MSTACRFSHHLSFKAFTLTVLGWHLTMSLLGKMRTAEMSANSSSTSGAKWRCQPRLDHHAFLNKNNLTITTTSGSNQNNSSTANAAVDETALVRYARLKCERSSQQSQPALDPVSGV